MSPPPTESNAPSELAQPAPARSQAPGRTKPTMQKVRRAIFVIGSLVAGFGYVSGWPLWSVLLLCFGVPLVCLIHDVFAGPLRRYRFLLVIYSIAGAIGVFEAWQYQRIPKGLVEGLNLEEGSGEPDLFLETELPQVLYDLFPHRAEALLARGFQMKLCAIERAQGRMPSVCAAFDNLEIAEIRRIFAEAIGTGANTDENLQYHYVEVLIRDKASQSEIDAATENWRRLFPYSKRPDPRDAFALRE